MRYLNSYNLSAHRDPVFEVQPEYAAMMGMLVTELQSLKTQLTTVQKQVEILELAAVRPIDRHRFRAVETTQYSDDSPMVKTALRSLKWLFLFLAGFALACILAVSLRVPNEAISLLVAFLQSWLLPLVGLTFAIVAVAVLRESLK